MTETVQSDIQTIRLTGGDWPDTYVDCWHCWILPGLVELFYVRRNGRITAVHARVAGRVLDDNRQPLDDRQDVDYGVSGDWVDWVADLADKHHPEKESR